MRKFRLILVLSMLVFSLFVAASNAYGQTSIDSTTLEELEAEIDAIELEYRARLDDSLRELAAAQAAADIYFRQYEAERDKLRREQLLTAKFQAKTKGWVWYVLGAATGVAVTAAGVGLLRF